MTMATTPKRPDSTTARTTGGGGREGEPSSQVAQMKSYLQGVRSEFTKINWPTRPQIVGQTVVVLLMTLLMTLILWVIDSTFRLTVGWITPHHGL